MVYLFFSGPLMDLFNSDDMTTETSGNSSLQIQEMVAGSGEIAERGDIISAHYVGRLIDGRVFDSSRDRGMPISFTLGVGQVIRGWDEGLQGMRVGGKRTLTISPEYAYGTQAVGGIPANSTLIFEVELVDVQKSR